MPVSAWPIDKIPYSELTKHQVWEYIAEPTEGQDETWAFSVSERPIHSLANRFASCSLRLANGEMVHALLGNLDLGNPTNTQYFLSICIVAPDGKRFHLARYHDYDYPESGPDALSSFLGRQLSEIFPIAFDISGFAIGDAKSVAGVIPHEPISRLSRSELILLATG